MSVLVAEAALFGVKYPADLRQKGLYIMCLRICIDVLCSVKICMAEQVLFYFRRDPRLFQTVRICVPQRVNGNGEADSL